MPNRVLLLILLGISASATAAVKSKCRLPVDSGECPLEKHANSIHSNSSSINYSNKTRYYYSSANYKCSPFPQECGGGNGNSFPTEEECRNECLGVPPKDWEDIKVAREKSNCWFKGRFFAIGDEIEEIPKDSPCSTACFCSEGDNGHPPRIMCAVYDCPPPPGRVNCYPTSPKDSCCPVYKCPEKDPNEDKSVFTCEVKGKKYYEGQKFYPDEYPCFSCTCNRNFTGEVTTRGGVCSEVNCSLLVYAQDKLAENCRPIYYKTRAGLESCCPIDWECD